MAWSEFGNEVSASGTFAVIYLDATNTENATRSLAETFRFSLDDDHGAHYAELSDGNGMVAAGAAQQARRDPLTAAIVPRGTTHALLIFDVAADAAPVTLVIHDAGLFSSDAVTVDSSVP